MATNAHRPISITTLLMLLVLAGAQPFPPTPDDENAAGGDFNSSTAVIIAVLVSAFILLVFFVFYFRAGRAAASGAGVRIYAVAEPRPTARSGIGQEKLEMLPTFKYSQVNGLKVGNTPLECAVCLSDFTDDETLRLLPRCCHVFHSDCIDVWLESHVTCPVCRSDISATVNDESTERESSPGTAPPRLDHVADRSALFQRSGTTGQHDRHTLRLPEHVQKEIRRSASFAAFPVAGGESSGRRGYRGTGGRRSVLARALSVSLPAWAAEGRGNTVEAPARVFPVDSVRNDGEASAASRPPV